MNANATISHPVRKIPKPRKRPPLERRFSHWLASNFVIPTGQCSGQPFELHDFQMEFLRNYLARDVDGPQYRTCILSTPRKLGKSTFLGALLVGHLCPDSPLYIPNATMAVAAPTEKQCGYIAKAMTAIMDAAGRGEELTTKANPRPGVLHVGSGTVMLNTGSNLSGHGSDLSLAICDETGLIPGHKGELVQGFYDALSAQNGQLILTGTRGDSGEYNEWIDRPDKRTYVCLHGAGREDDASDPAVWEKANPDGGKIKPRRFLQDAYEKAEASGSLASFKNWQLNVPISATRELLLDYDTLAKSYRPEAEPMPEEPCFVGLDLGGSSSMTAATIAYESGVVKVLGAFPNGEMDLVTRGKRDQVGDFYVRAAEAGDLIETSGAVSDLQQFLTELIQRIGPHPVRSVSCDRYRDAELRTAMARAKLSIPLEFRGNGPKDGNADVLATRRLFKAGAISMQRSILLEGSLAEADVKVSTTGAVQICKSHLTARIDVAQSLILACSALLRSRDAVKPTYEVEVL